MPKRSNKSWRNRAATDDKHYFGHDDRVVKINDGPFLVGSRPRVSFKTHTRPREFVASRKCDMMLTNLEEDIPMAGSSNNNTRQVIIRERSRGMCRGRNSPLPNRNFRGSPMSGSRSRPLPLGDSSWYRISIPFGQKYDKDYILRTLMNYMAPEAFIPMVYKTMANEANFYVDDQKTANALLNCDRKITMTDGFKMIVKVKPGFPQCEIDDKLKERLKLAMSKRYVQETNALDLSKFHHDPDLVSDYFCALFRPVMLMAVLEIVAEHIPTLDALNLEGNKLHIIERLNVLHKKFPQLKILYLGDNKIREINQIDVLKDLKLEELRLAGNPVCNKYKSRQNDYIGDIRKRFPKLLRLDGMELPRPIVFDVADEGAKTPSIQKMFVANAKAWDIASQFLQQYFQIFDSGNRQPLLDAYDEQASFSLTISYMHANKLNGYLTENRNLFRIIDAVRRHKLLKHGKLPVVSFISEMPQTKHFVDTFTMDITLPTQTMMFVTITGYFQELDKKTELIRHFNRTFIIIPEGSGYCIRNEQLHISAQTDAQVKQLKSQYNLTEQPALLVSQNPPVQSEITKLEVATPPPLNEEIRQQMVVTLSQQTNMNLEWSLKCLQEVQWNYDNALAAFQDFFKRGQIPPEAFTK